MFKIVLSFHQNYDVARVTHSPETSFSPSLKFSVDVTEFRSHLPKLKPDPMVFFKIKYHLRDS